MLKWREDWCWWVNHIGFGSFEVDGDVDVSIGNISFVGSIIVRGTIRSGFKVEAEGDIEVWGNVEAATVQSQGNVIIRGNIWARKRVGESKRRCKS